MTSREPCGRQSITQRLQRFVDRYGKALSEAELTIERTVFDANVGVSGYTTIEQADALADRLGIGPGARLLDIGAGRGWPGLHLATKSGCDIVVTDVPAEGLRHALGRSAGLGLAGRSSAMRASATALPFRARSFDAVVHADAL